jgi:hypothetical protein
MAVAQHVIGARAVGQLDLDRTALVSSTSQPCAASSASIFTRAKASFGMAGGRLTQQLRHRAHRYEHTARLGLQGG